LESLERQGLCGQLWLNKDWSVNEKTLVFQRTMLNVLEKTIKKCIHLRKINIEPENDGLEDHVPFSMGDL